MKRKAIGPGKRDLKIKHRSNHEGSKEEPMKEAGKGGRTTAPKNGKLSRRERVVDIKTFAKHAAPHYSEQTGTSKTQAVEDMTSAIQQLLRGLKKGEKVELPTGSVSKEDLVFTKLSKDTFSVSQE